MAGSFAARVVAWHERHGRAGLPWQQPATPYRVWVSEVMLQQTRVETAIGYFGRFVTRFPDVAALAAADLDDVLRLWSGLGYYARARNLHRAARRIVADHGGELPDRFDELLALPGIGRSTAAAIQSLGRGRRHAILDANVKRVLARHTGLEDWPGRSAAQRALWAAAEARTPSARVAVYNQAIMDLGASVCVRRPRCQACPVAADCRARRDGTTDRIPAPPPRRERPQRETVALVLQHAVDGAILLRRRPDSGIWGGLWSLPEFASERRLREWLAARDCRVELQALAPIEHGFTHFRLRIHPRRAVADPPAAVADGDGFDWYRPGGVPGGLPAPVRRLADDLAGAGPGPIA